MHTKEKAAKRARLSERRAAASKNKALTRVVLIFFGFVLVYILQSIIMFAVKPHIAIDRIEPGGVTSPVDLSGVIIRDEQVYKSPGAGTVRFDVAENARVKKDETVCDVENADEVARINAEMADVNTELLNVQALRSDNTGTDENEQRVNLLIKNMLDDWPGRMQKSDFSLVYSLKGSLTANVDVRNRIIIGNGAGALKDQADELQMYQDQLDRYMTPIKSEDSGIVSIQLDGYEDTYTPGITAMMQKEQTAQKGGAAKPFTDRAVQEGTPVFKIIKSNTWYIASYLPNELVKGWNPGDSKVLYIGSAPGLPVSVDHLTQKGGESYVLFTCTRFMENFMASRFINFKIGADNNQGLKIAQPAVISKTLLCIPREYVSIDSDQLKTAKVTETNGDKLNISYVAIDDGMVYADPDKSVIKPGMELQSLTDAQNKFTLSETANITGVYRVNNGAADFRKIILDTSTLKDGFYILDPVSNKNLQENDSIVHDASKVNEGDIIF